MKERFQGIESSILEAIQADLARAPKVEHCGLLLARPGSSLVESRVAYPGPLRSREFALPEEWLLQAFLQQRGLGFEVAGFYHTHPVGEGLAPSPLDRAGHPPGSLVLLVGPSRWQAYRIGEKRWQSLALELRSSPTG